MVGAVHGMMVADEADDRASRDFGYVYFKLFARGLREGWFKPHPYEVVPGGLSGVETGLTNLKAGKASAVKYIFEIGA